MKTNPPCSRRFPLVFAFCLSCLAGALGAGTEIDTTKIEQVYFMHIGGEGNLEQLATGVRKALDKVKEIRAANPQPAKAFGRVIPPGNSITAKPLEDALGVKGQSNNGRQNCARHSGQVTGKD